MATYRATAYHPQYERKQAAGTIETDPGGIRFVPADGSAGITLPLHGLSVTVGGAAHPIFFLNHPSEPEWSLYTSDRAILTDPHLAPSATGAVSTLRRERRARWSWVVVALALLAGFVWGAIWMKDIVVSAIAKRIPADVEKRVGDAAYAQITATQKLITDPAVVKPLSDLAARLAPHAARGLREFRVVVADDPLVNAFALPGGTIIFNSGLLLEASSADEIAGVMAHELAHVTERHSMRQLVSNVGTFAVVQALFGDVSGMTAVLVEGGASLLTMSYSRDFEREADDVGLETLAKAGLDTRGMVRFFEVLKEQEKKRGVTPPALLSTHPATEERIARLQRKAADLSPAAAKPPFDLAALQSALKSSASPRAK